MVILAAADIHGNWDTCRWLAEVVREEGPNLVVLAGDLLGAPESYETAESDQLSHAEILFELFRSVAVPVLYVMGNDDWVELPPRPGWFSLHLRRIGLGRFNFVGYQNTTRFMGGPHERTEEEIEGDLTRIEGKLDARTVFVTHGPARAVLDGGHGSTALAALLRQREVLAHIHGHSHFNFGRSGSSFNVAAGTRQQAMLIELETLEHRVSRKRPPNRI